MSNEIKVVACLPNGAILRGTTADFWPTHPTFHIKELARPNGSPAREVAFADLKAVHIVTSLEGATGRFDSRGLSASGPVNGSPVRVVFKDGESLVGTTMNFDPQATGFFMFPADRGSNTQRVFVVNAAVDRVEQVAVAAG